MRFGDEELFLGGAITVRRRSADFMAYVTEHNEVWDRGGTVAEAIGNLVRTAPDEIINAVTLLPDR